MSLYRSEDVPKLETTLGIKSVRVMAITYHVSVNNYGTCTFPQTPLSRSRLQWNKHTALHSATRGNAGVLSTHQHNTLHPACSALPGTQDQQRSPRNSVCKKGLEHWRHQNQWPLNTGRGEASQQEPKSLHCRQKKATSKPKESILEG